MISIIENFIKDIFKGGVDLLFPPLCFNCDKKLYDGEKIICEKCWSKIPKISDEIIQKKHAGENIDKIDTLWLFDQNFQNIVHHLKYNNCQSLGFRIGQEMGKYLSKKYTLKSENCILIPVPLHPVKKRERGYNQSGKIAEGIHSVTGIQINEKLVKRTKNTATQTKMNKTERIENMQAAFSSSMKIEQKIAIIIDDVYTTGTTVNSVAESIKKNNKNIEIWSFTAAMPES